MTTKAHARPDMTPPTNDVISGFNIPVQFLQGLGQAGHGGVHFRHVGGLAVVVLQGGVVGVRGGLVTSVSAAHFRWQFDGGRTAEAKVDRGRGLFNQPLSRQIGVRSEKEKFIILK